MSRNAWMSEGGKVNRVTRVPAGKEQPFDVRPIRGAILFFHFLFLRDSAIDLVPEQVPQFSGMLSFRPNRFLCLLMVVLITGCTSVKKVPFSELEGRKPLKGTYIITTRDDKVLKTDRLAVEDSALVVSAVIVDGGRRNVEPYSIPYENVVSVSRERTNWIVLTGVVAALTACVIGIGSALGKMGPIGQ